MKSSPHSPVDPAGRIIAVILIILGLLSTTPAIPARADDDGYALAFDGVNDMVELARTALMMASTWKNTKTVELWVKPEGTPVTCESHLVATCDYIFGDKPEWWGITRGVLDGLDRIWIFNYDGSVGSVMDQIGVPYTPGVWVHIALVHSGGMLTAYRNGVEIDSIPSGTTMQPNDGPILYLGGVIFSSTRNFTLQGQIDEVRIWNIARSAAAINADMRRLLTGSEAGLAAYYQMSDGAGTTLTDDSLNNWNGALLDGDNNLGVPPNGSPPQWVTSTAFDILPPGVTINQAGSQADPTNTGPIIFDVVFSEVVTGFNNPADVNLSASTVGGSPVASISGSGAIYTVSVSGMSGNGTVVASIPAGVAQNASLVGNSLSTSSDNSVTFDSTAPTVTINPAPGQPDPDNTAPVNFQVVFSETVTDFSAADVNLALSTTPGALSALVTGSGTTYNVAVSGMSGSGTVIASIPAGVAHDAVGNANTLSTGDNNVSYDVTAPTVTINPAPSQPDPDNTAPVNFQVVFSETVTDFSAADVNLALSTTPGALSALVTGSGTTYNVAVSGMSGSGTVVASIPAGGVHDAAGNANTLSTGDNNVTYDVTHPTVTINPAPGQPDPANAPPILFAVVFSEAVSGFSSSDVILSGSAGATAASVTGAGAAYTISVIGMTHTGTVIVSIPVGAAFDAAGNANSASSGDNSMDFIYLQGIFFPIVIN